MNALQFAVAIPARDEEVLLPRLLDSLAMQDRGWDDGQVFLVANNCSDGTADIARKFAERLPITVIEATYPTADAHVGTARKRALDAACDWLEGRPGNGALLTTDADATVAPNWILANLHALDGCDIAGGRLVADDEDDPSPLQVLIDAYWVGVREIDAALDPQEHDPPPRHGDHTGASLAFRANLYRRLGGLTPLPTREDVDFVDRALRAGARLAHPIDVSVRVSTRIAGRAAGGMAAEMVRRQSLGGRHDTYLLPHPDDWIERSLARCRLRLAWRAQGDLAKALARECIAEVAASDILADCPNDVAFVERASAMFSIEPRQEIAVDAAVTMMADRARHHDQSQAVA